MTYLRCCHGVGKSRDNCVAYIAIVKMTTPGVSSPVIKNDLDTETVHSIADDNRGDTVVVGKRVLPKLNWVWLNHQGEKHDSRRLLDHRARNCLCDLCVRELNKLPPEEPLREKLKARKQKEEEREKRRVKRKARKDVKAGKQASIRNFFRY